MDKLNSMRALERAHIPYKLHQVQMEQHDPADRHSATELARKLGLDAARVFKTLVVLPGAGRPVLVMLPADATLDLKGLARALGVKQASMPTADQAEALTGLKVGGIGALALLGKGWRCYIDRSALDLEGGILVSAGRRGCSLELAADDLVRLTKAEVLPLSQAPA